MNNGNPTPTVDKKLMKLAKKRTFFRSFLKWIFTGGIIASIFQTVIWFFSEDRASFWPGWFMLKWGITLTILGIIFKLTRTSDSNRKIMAEYNKLKNEEKNI